MEESGSALCGGWWRLLKPTMISELGEKGGERRERKVKEEGRKERREEGAGGGGGGVFCCWFAVSGSTIDSRSLIFFTAETETVSFHCSRYVYNIVQCLTVLLFCITSQCFCML